MDAKESCRNGIFDLITKLAEKLLHDESAQYEQTAAIDIVPSPSLVAKKRTEIYKYLLRPKTAPGCYDSPNRCGDKLTQCQRLLDKYRELLDPTLINNIAYSLWKITIPREIRIPKDDAKRFGKQFRLLVPGPLRLSNRSSNEQLNNCITQMRPQMLKSVDEMRSLLEPIKFQRNSNSVLSDITVLRKALNNCKGDNFSISTLGSSMKRITQSTKGFHQGRLTTWFTLPTEGKANQRDRSNARSSKTAAPEKHFLSDICVTNELKWHQNQSLELSFIELPSLIDHLKQAAAGLQSETFTCAADEILSLRQNTTISSVLPEVLAEFAQPFLDSGTAFRRLTARTQRSLTPNQIERPLNRTIRHAINIFLANCRLYLLSLSEPNLSKLFRSALPTIELVHRLELMFQGHPSLDISDGADGASLLQFIWSAIEVGISDEFFQLLLYLFKSLCTTYFGQLEHWIYQSELEEPFNELFISSSEQKSLNERSKEFFDKGFILRSDAIPDILSGCEQAILQCGKYNRLLKTYNPQHVAFSMKHPHLVVCLSDQEMHEMSQKLELHYKEILQHTKPFCMQNIFEELTVRRQHFDKRMLERTRAHIAVWERQQHELKLKANAEKQQLYEDLNEQLKMQEQIRLEQRRLEVVDVLLHQQKCDALEEKRLNQEKQELKEEVSILLKGSVPIELTTASTSPESSCSTRSFVSCCDIPDIEEFMELPNSQSDVLNCNHNTEISRNRMRNMSSEQFKDTQTLVQLRQSATSSSVIHSEAERNRLRVLGTTKQIAQLPPDMNMNLEDLSDLQRNRKRMQEHDTFVLFHCTEDDHSSRAKRIISLDTQLAQNRRKIMENEFYLPLERHKLHVNTALDTATPMSTTSDVDVEELESLKSSETIIAVDVANNNSVKIVVQSNSTENINSNDTSCVNIEANMNQHIPKPLEKPIDAISKHDPMSFESYKTAFQLPTLRQETYESPQLQPTYGRNPFMIKRYIQMSIMVPLNAHLSLLRSEALRIIHELGAYEYFRQLRNYFFLLDGEFGTLLIGGILENIEAGMSPRSLCQKGILDSILNNALCKRGIDIYDAEPSILLVDKLELNCTNIPDQFELMNIDVLSIVTLDCKVDWPLNLVISAETLAKYAQIFSYLLKIRHVSYMLERAFTYLQQLSKLHGRKIQSATQYRYLQIVRNKLSQFVITLQNHLETNALQATWKRFNDQLRTVDCVEELYQRHVDYLKEVAFLLMLNRQSEKFQKTVDNILVIVLRFCKILHSQPFVLNENEQFVHPRYKRLVFEEGEFEKFMRYIIYLGNKIADSGYQEQIVDLIRIINFNNYYNVFTASN